MNDQIEEKPCKRGCTWPIVDGDALKPRAATHGHYCNRCHGRLYRALKKAGPLVEHVVSLLASQSKHDDGTQRLKGDPPMPLNAAAFNDANEIYSRLVYWCSLWSTRIGQQAPGPAKKAWRADNNTIVGLPADISPTAARYAVGVMGSWLTVNLYAILDTWWFDDIEYFMDEVGGDLETVLAKFPTEDKPTFSKRTACPDDRARLVIYPPQFAGDNQLIVCEHCHRVFSESQHEFYAHLWKQTQDEKRTAKNAIAHLMRTYGGQVSA